MKPAHHPEYVAVDLYDAFRAPIFPQFVPIADLHIRVATVIIVLQRMKADILVAGKIIIPAAVASMAVAEKHITAARCQFSDRCIFVCFFNLLKMQNVRD